MGKGISNYTCSQCGYMAPKWMGKCPGCGLWNTFYEEMGFKDRSGQKKGMVDAVPLDSIGESECFRYVSGCGELDRVLGGGIVPGSLILIGGDPGIGKSTLLLQVAGKFTRIHNKKVIYLSGEESLKQIKLRSMRLGINSNSILLLNEQCLDTLDDYMEEINPELVIVDSIQTVFLSGLSSVPGSVAQLRECTAKIMDVAKKREKAFIIVGHVTKDGVLAGPKVLEHMVDVVIYFEGDKNFLFRILRGVKNRFGPTDEIGILEMNSTGLVEVADPSSLFLSFRQQEMIGSAIGATLEGTRPLLIEIQALVSPSGPGYPRRMASGIDQNRLALITAVLEKKRGYNMAATDVYIKVAGGVFLKDPSVDLSIVASILSSYHDIPLPRDTVFIGELGLSGEIRPVPMMDIRLKEADKLGYKRVLLSGLPLGYEMPQCNLKLVRLNSIEELAKRILEGDF